MIANAAYVKRLLKQWAEGTLSEEGQTELHVARHFYSEEEWLRMEVDACCELEDGRPDRRPVDWHPAFERAKRRERKKQSKATTVSRLATALGAAALLLLVVWWGGLMSPERPRPMDLGNNCPVWASDGEIPGSEFACTVWWGDSTSITVDRTSRGRLGVIRNVEIWRYADGALALLPVGYPREADTTEIPAIRVATHPYQQCVVRLPGGSEVRLNAGSVLEYPLSNLARDTTFLRLSGQALVQLEEKRAERGEVKLIITTPNAELQMAGGAYTVLAERNETRAVLLEGKAVLFSRGGVERQELLFPGDVVTMEQCCIAPDSTITTKVDVSCIAEKEALAWTRMKRTYRNTPVREFVADMSRWYGFKVENMNCVPEGPRITATVCYRAPVAEVYAQLYAADVFMVEKDGMVSFCGPPVDPLQPSLPVPMPDEHGLLALRTGENHISF
ncbi:FecR family protein [Parapedobacter koreensis]|uniref:FecR family protein n=1 Tax=Parapedobacter koreensis TaxID=332977 RepID=A0A1H7GSY2_9SPHI|nr:FecR family protein [Parapedobacter koreensis]SEK41198.1 FecR family protein [Parapedobacter koreensis]